MHTLRRRSSRRRCYRAAKIQLRGGTWARDCLVIDISDVGVRLNAEGLDVPDEFVLLLPPTASCGRAHARWSGGAAMKLAPSSLLPPSDRALPSRKSILLESFSN